MKHFFSPDPNMILRLSLLDLDNILTTMSTMFNEDSTFWSLHSLVHKQQTAYEHMTLSRG